MTESDEVERRNAADAVLKAALGYNAAVERARAFGLETVVKTVDAVGQIFVRITRTTTYAG